VEKVEFKQLGQKLKETRENKNISLEEISEKTKINLGFLKNFENGEFDFLPEFYIRHFLKDYLNCIGRSAMHFLDEFEQLKKQAEKAEQSEEEIESAKNSPKILQIFEMVGIKGVSSLKFH
jgi:cytoskeletal protein RodZ